MRRAVLGLALSLGVAGAAMAGDYVVVASTDPGLKPGVELTGGQRVALGPGKTATLIYLNGEVTTLRGGASGAEVPSRKAPLANAQRMASLKALIAPPEAGRTFGGRRSGVCPDPAGLKTLDDILAVQDAGCTTQAKQALDAYVAHAQHH